MNCMYGDSIGGRLVHSHVDVEKQKEKKEESKSKSICSCHNYCLRTVFITTVYGLFPLVCGVWVMTLYVWPTTNATTRLPSWMLILRAARA